MQTVCSAGKPDFWVSSWYYKSYPHPDGIVSTGWRRLGGPAVARHHGKCTYVKLACMSWEKKNLRWGQKEQRVPEVWIVTLLILIYKCTMSQIANDAFLSLLNIYHTLLRSQAPFAVKKKKKKIMAFFECMSGDFTGFATTVTLGASDRTFQLQPCVSLCASPQRGRSSKLLILMQSY